MGDNRKNGHVRGLAAFFERLSNKRQKPQPSLDRGTQTVKEPSFSTPQELPTTPYEASFENSTLSIPFLKIKSKYFDRSPMNTWVICLELRSAISYGAPVHYQQRLLDLLIQQTQKMDALCIGIAQFYDPQKATQDDILTQPKLDTGLLSMLASGFSEGFSNLCSGHHNEQSFVETIHTEATTTHQFSYLSHHSQNALEKLNLRPTQDELKAYPQLLIKIIDEFLSLTEESEYKDFLKQTMKKDYERFITLDEREAKQHFKETLHTQSFLISRESLNAAFQKQQENKFSSLTKDRRKNLNIEFREMMRVVLYSLLLNLRKELSTNDLWIHNNPRKLLQPLKKEWLLENENIFKNYLRRLNSEYPKNIPIEYPIYTKYTVKTISFSLGKKEIKLSLQEKIDDALRWINRVTLLEVAPIGNTITAESQQDEVHLASIFSSNRNFIDWLRKDPSISLFYTRKEEAKSNQAYNDPTMILTIDISDLKPVKALYFDDLCSKINYYSGHASEEICSDTHQSDLSDPQTSLSLQGK